MPSEAAAPAAGGRQPTGRALRAALLILALTLTCVIGFATTYIMALLAIAAAGYWLYRRREMAWVFDTPAKLFLGAFLVLAALFALTAEAPADALSAFNFTAFLVYAPMATLLAQGAASGNTRRVAWLALAGAGIGCAASVIEVYGYGTGRAGVLISDPIRLADTAVILGFLALMGFAQQKDATRWLFLLGPLFALLTVVLTGARIAMVAYPVLVVAAIILLSRRKWLGLLIGAAGAGVLVVAALSGIFGSARMDSLFAVINELLATGTVGDEAVRIRLELYRAGWAAFQQSPIIGHGWAELMAAPAAFLAETDKVHAGLPHLHNEVLNFAVAGGLVGVAVYLTLIAMPVVVALRSRRDSQYGARLFGCTILATAYLVMGLTDTMLSFELHTALYVAYCAILLNYCRDSGART
jgi:O-antigen ligase